MKENEDWLNQTLTFNTEVETFLAQQNSTDTGTETEPTSDLPGTVYVYVLQCILAFSNQKTVF